MKLLIVILKIYMLSEPLFAQTLNYSIKEISQHFEQTKEITERHIKLWDKDIYAPILLIDPKTREVFANVQDEAGELKIYNELHDGKEDGIHDTIYIGLLPRTVPVSNTDITWNGIHWAMLELPLPEGRYDRIDLTTHELFHRAQPFLGFNMIRENNNHLDQKDGRIYLRLELAALEAALKSSRLKISEEHLRNALIFRKYRHILYRGSQQSENYLELLEGLATYTGQMMSGRNKWEWREYLIKRIAEFDKSQSFIRSFAYETTPVYGFFLQQKDYYWNKKADNETNLTDFFSDAFGLESRILLQSYVRQVANEYGYKKIVDEEMSRSSIHQSSLDEYRDKFFERTRLEIRLEDMTMSFDPTNLIPLDEDEGIIYPQIILSDNWGILTVKEGGVLLRSDWHWLVVSEPTEITDDRIMGEGWVIELNEGYGIEENFEGNYILIKRRNF